MNLANYASTITIANADTRTVTDEYGSVYRFMFNHSFNVGDVVHVWFNRYLMPEENRVVAYTTENDDTIYYCEHGTPVALKAVEVRYEETNMMQYSYVLDNTADLGRIVASDLGCSTGYLARGKVDDNAPTCKVWVIYSRK